MLTSQSFQFKHPNSKSMLLLYVNDAWFVFRKHIHLSIKVLMLWLVIVIVAMGLTYTFTPFHFHPLIILEHCTNNKVFVCGLVKNDPIYVTRKHKQKRLQIVTFVEWVDDDVFDQITNDDNGMTKNLIQIQLFSSFWFLIQFTWNVRRTSVDFPILFRYRHAHNHVEFPCICFELTARNPLRIVI